MRLRSAQRRAGRRRYSPTLISADSRSAAAEAYRVLRTNLLLSSDRPIGSALFTSSTSGEGKSITCANLGLLLSQGERRVAILDADLRMPSQQLIFDVPGAGYALRLQSHGGADVAADAHSVCAMAVEVAPNLSVLPVGVPPDNPAELLESVQFSIFLHTLKEQFDMVIVDSPPVGLVTDAAIIAPLVDGVVVVLDHRQPDRRRTRRAVDALDKVHANLLGLVVNNASTNSLEATYGYGPAREA